MWGGSKEEATVERDVSPSRIGRVTGFLERLGRNSGVIDLKQSGLSDIPSRLNPLPCEGGSQVADKSHVKRIH